MVHTELPAHSQRKINKSYCDVFPETEKPQDMLYYTTANERTNVCTEVLLNVQIRVWVCQKKGNRKQVSDVFAPAILSFQICSIFTLKIN